MDGRQMKDAQSESSWIPHTPPKPGQAKSQSICKGNQEIGLSVPYWLNTVGTSEAPEVNLGSYRSHLGKSICFQQKVQAQNVGDLTSNSVHVRFDNWGSEGAVNPFDCTNDPQLYFALCKRELERGADAAAAAEARTGLHSESSSCTSASIYQFQCSLSLAESSNTSFGDNGLIHESVPQDQMEGADKSADCLYHLVPMIPKPTNTANQMKGSDEPNFWLGKAAKENEENTLNKTTVDFSDLQNKGQSEQILDVSCSTMSKILQENHEPDVGSNQNINLKTPLQKPRRKKHRPKVVNENKPKRNPRTKKPACSEKTTAEKRKYVRRNRSSNQGDPPTENKITCDPGSDALPKPKRKYTRRKAVDIPTTTSPKEGVSGTTSPKANQATRRSCRRSLKFESDGQIVGEMSSCQRISDLCSESTSVISHADNQMTSKMNLGGVDINADRSETGLDSRIWESMKKGFEDCLWTKGTKAFCPSTPVKCDQLDNRSMAGSPNECSRGKCHATHDKEASILESRTQNDWCTSNFPCTPNGNGNLNQERHARGTKRQQPSSADLSDSSSMNAPGAHCNSLKDFLEILQSNENKGECSTVRFPSMYKKKKTDEVHMAISMLPISDSRIQYNASPYDNLSRQASRRSRDFGMTQAHSSADSSLSRISTYNAGSAPDTMSKSMPAVDAIIEQFNRLAIATESNMLANLEKNALIAYCCEYSGQNALAVYRNDQTIVPFDASNRIRQRRPRPKVNLDEETTRVWNLLLENINSDGIDGTDEEKRKWWREERKVFRGRANSFIAKMRQVQGDRRFRPWKGSVLDSVIGVFLTQNVSDHLSSSAFISMAARFPLKPIGDLASSCEGIGEKHVFQSEEDTSVEDPGPLHAMKNFNKNDQNNRNFIGNSPEDTESIINLKSPSSDSSECGPSMVTDVKISEFDTLNHKTLMLHGDQKVLDEILSSQSSVVSSQNSIDSACQTAHRKELCSHSSSEEESTSKHCHYTSFVELLQMQEQRVHNQGTIKGSPLVETRTKLEVTKGNLERYANQKNFAQSPSSSFPRNFKENERCAIEQSGLSEESPAGPSFQITADFRFGQQTFCNENHDSPSYRRLVDDQQMELVSKVQKYLSNFSEGIFDAWGRPSIIDETVNPKRTSVNLDTRSSKNVVQTASGANPEAPKTKGGKNAKEKQNEIDWDSLRKEAQAKGKRERAANTMDSVDWEAVRCADVGEIAQTIKERGMNNRLAVRIKDFLNRLVSKHGSIDLEWLRDVPPDKAKEYLLSVKGLGLKSVECVRLLTLHHVAFPVDTNVGRIAVRLGWVPLQPLPESLQLHLLELYPVLESIQKYLWPRLCKLDQKKLYELHYQMITFGKVFCTKSKPNCNSCPMRGECRHFASAYASARLALPAPEDKSIVSSVENRTAYGTQAKKLDHLQLPRPESTEELGARSLPQPVIAMPTTPKPIIEEPESPEPEPEPIIEEPQTSESESESETEPEQTQFPVDLEDSFMDNDDEIPTIVLNVEAFNQNVQNVMQNSIALHDSEKSKALVVLTPEAASIPMPKLKNINQLRTEHLVYVLPDSHQLLKGLDKREQYDPCPYLLAIWTPGETINSVQPPERRCSSEESGRLCYHDTCFSCNSIREVTSQTVRGTLLIPCRTAMRGSFPLNGTYFQVNEVFADHETSLNPIDIPRDWVWNLRRRTVYFGTSIPTIFKGLGPTEIQHCFWKGFVCVRGFDRATRAPRPLIARLHFPASKMTKNKGKTAGSHV